MVVLFVNENDFCYYRNCLYNHRYKFNSEKEQVNESQYIVTRLDSVRIRHSGRIGNEGMTISFSSFGSMIYCILCTITYIISYLVPISCLFPCSGYTPMLYYSFLTYCFIIFFLIRSCLVIYFTFVFSYT